jgi:16S rRNA (cytidine1402-2'-O)-methyltransferase
VEAGVAIEVIPGPTAVETALAYSGFLAQQFYFLGFLPERPATRQEVLQRAARQTGALVCFEAPHRLLESLQDMGQVLGDRPAVAARELTKRFEEVVRGRLSTLAEHFASHPPRGEFTLVIAGAPLSAETGQLAVGVQEARELIAAGLSPSRAAAHLAKWRRLSRRDLYQALLGAAGDG